LVTRRPATGACETTVFARVTGAGGATGCMSPWVSGLGIEATGRMVEGRASMLVMCRPMAETRAEAAARLRPMRFGIT